MSIYFISCMITASTDYRRFGDFRGPGIFRLAKKCPGTRMNDMFPSRLGRGKTCGQTRRYTQITKPWETDPTYRKIVPPKSRAKWTPPKVPEEVVRPPYARAGEISPWHDIIPVGCDIGPPEWYDEYLILGMRNAGRVAAECLSYAKSLVAPGVTTRAIDAKVTDWVFARKCYPSSLNYGGFQGGLCTSVNNVISHGVPNELRQLQLH
jgi:Metallopeptidase family M24